MPPGHVTTYFETSPHNWLVMVDLGSQQFEAILFAVLACSFYLLESFVDDLEDPFGGSWTVDAALDACDELVDALAVEE